MPRQNACSTWTNTVAKKVVSHHPKKRCAWGKGKAPVAMATGAIPRRTTQIASSLSRSRRNHRPNTR